MLRHNISPKNGRFISTICQRLSIYINISIWSKIQFEFDVKTIRKYKHNPDVYICLIFLHLVRKRRHVGFNAKCCLQTTESLTKRPSYFRISYEFTLRLFAETTMLNICLIQWSIFYIFVAYYTWLRTLLLGYVREITKTTNF